MVLTNKTVRKELNFAELGMPHLELRASYAKGSGKSDPVAVVVIEEPPSMKMISLNKSRKTRVPVWIPWTYHHLFVGDIDKVTWQADGTRYKMSASHEQRVSLPKDLMFESAPYPNIAHYGTVCYQAQTYEGLSPVEKLGRSISDWWFGRFNMDYHPSTYGLQFEIVKIMYDAGYGENNPYYDRAEGPTVLCSYLYDTKDADAYVHAWSQLSLEEVLNAVRTSTKPKYSFSYVERSYAPFIGAISNKGLIEYSNRYSQNKKFAKTINYKEVALAT